MSSEDEKHAASLSRQVTATDKELEAGPHTVIGREPTDPYLVDFIKPYDPTNPRDWSLKWKVIVTALMSATGFNRILVSTIMAPGLSTIASDLHMSSVESVMSLSVYLLATAIGPLVLGPLSEVYGRRNLTHTTNWFFFAWNLICGFSHSQALLISSRLLAGFGASAFFSIGYGVLGDIWAPEHRGRSLTFYMLVPVLGACVGPVVGGFITAYTTWRWMFWSTAILQAVLTTLSIPLFPETYAPAILATKAATLRAATGDVRHSTKVERLHEHRSAAWVVRRSLSRPLRLLMFHPIIQTQALLSGFSYGVLYITLSSYAELYVTRYRDPFQLAGLHYVALTLGEVAGYQLIGPLTDLVYRRLTARHAVFQPEYRAPLLVPGALLMPVGLLLYGWAAQFHLPWPVVDAGGLLFVMGFSMFASPLQAYAIDAYPEHVGSASAATQLVKSLGAFALPLFQPRMYAVLGYGWGNTLLACVALVLGVPVPLLVWKYGAALRARARSSW